MLFKYFQKYFEIIVYVLASWNQHYLSLPCHVCVIGSNIFF